MRARLASWRNDRSGASAVEFTIIAPVLTMATIGIIVTGWTMNCISSLRLALEAAGRALEVNQTLTQDDLSAIARTKLSAIGDPNVTVTMTNETSVTGVTIKKLTGTYVVDINIPFVPLEPFTLTTEVLVPLKVSG